MQRLRLRYEKSKKSARATSRSDTRYRIGGAEAKWAAGIDDPILEVSSHAGWHASRPRPTKRHFAKTVDSDAK